MCCAPHRARRSCPRTPRVAPRAARRSWTCRPPGLKTRLAHTGTHSAVIGLSGGLDSTLALIVTVRAFDMLGLPRTASMRCPCPASARRAAPSPTPSAWPSNWVSTFAPSRSGEAVRAHFADIGHDPSVTDVTYENAQARERTQVLMDLSNELGGFVIGTGDLSELALGWATYNADHMSMYGVNAGVPKTLVRHLVSHAADSLGGEAAAILRDIHSTRPSRPSCCRPAATARSRSAPRSSSARMNCTISSCST
ncbi:MAG: hypothetical protein ACLTSX_01945 [Collinsella sp.]